MESVKQIIRDIPDFPKKGIIFKDIAPLLADAPAFRKTINTLKERYSNNWRDIWWGRLEKNKVRPNQKCRSEYNSKDLCRFDWAWRSLGYQARARGKRFGTILCWWSVPTYHDFVGRSGKTYHNCGRRTVGDLITNRHMLEMHHE